MTLPNKNHLICTPVMLPVKDSTSPIWIDDVGIIRFTTNVQTYHPIGHQHLYLVSDEEIKEGDWFRSASSIVKCVRREVYRPTTAQKSVNSLYDDQGREWFSDDSQKVKSTTDKSLFLPLIPSSFIEEYVAKQGNIAKVKIKSIISFNGDFIPYWKFPEIEIIILPMEDKTYSREEFKSEMYKAWVESAAKERNNTNPLTFPNAIYFSQWFDKEYPI